MGGGGGGGAAAAAAAAAPSTPPHAHVDPDSSFPHPHSNPPFLSPLSPKPCRTLTAAAAAAAAATWMSRWQPPAQQAACCWLRSEVRGPSLHSLPCPALPTWPMCLFPCPHPPTHPPNTPPGGGPSLLQCPQCLRTSPPTPAPPHPCWLPLSRFTCLCSCLPANSGPQLAPEAGRPPPLVCPLHHPPLAAEGGASTPPPSLPALLSTLVALLGPDQDGEVQRTALAVVRRLAAARPGGRVVVVG